jgi:hypothetical protein
VNNAMGEPAMSFAIPAEGGQSWVTTGQSVSIGVGHARVQQDTGNLGLSGLSIFGFRHAGVLVTEAGVPALPPTNSGRIYVEVRGPVNTGIAFANADGRPAEISFFFTDTAGNDFGRGSFRLNGRNQLAAFMNQAPFNGGTMEGTFTFSSTAPVGVIAIRGLTNERGEFLITTLPVSAIGGTNNNPIALPHFADGGGWTSQVILTNPLDTPLTGYAEFFTPGSAGQAGAAMNLAVNGVTGSRFEYRIPPRSVVRLVTGNTGAAVQVGSVRITPSGAAPTPAAIFSFRSNGFTVSEAGIPVLSAARAFRMYAEVFSSAGLIESGLAVANPSPSAVTVSLALVGMNGSSPVAPVTVTVPGNGQLARFIRQLFPALTGNFRGFLRVTADSPVTVIGVRGRYNERADFLLTTTPPRNEEQIVPASQILFPHFASGGGYTTQFIVFGQTSSGRLSFNSQNGAPLPQESVQPTP